MLAASETDATSRRSAAHGAQRHRTALRAALRRGAQVVAAFGAESHAVTPARVDRTAEAQRGKDRENQGEEPVRDTEVPTSQEPVVPIGDEQKAQTIPVDVHIELATPVMLRSGPLSVVELTVVLSIGHAIRKKPDHTRLSHESH